MNENLLFSVSIMSMMVVLNAAGGPTIIHSAPSNVQVGQQTGLVPEAAPVLPEPKIPEPVIPNEAEPRPNLVPPDADQPVLPRHLPANLESGQGTSPGQTIPPGPLIPPGQTILTGKTVPPGSTIPPSRIIPPVMTTIPPGPPLLPPGQPLLPGKPILPANPPQASVLNHTN